MESLTGSQIQKLVSVKDSFTRMNLERERERKQHQAAYTASVQAKQKQTQERAPRATAAVRNYATMRHTPFYICRLARGSLAT